VRELLVCFCRSAWALQPSCLFLGEFPVSELVTKQILVTPHCGLTHVLTAFERNNYRHSVLDWTIPSRVCPVATFGSFLRSLGLFQPTSLPSAPVPASFWWWFPLGLLRDGVTFAGPPHFPVFRGSIHLSLPYRAFSTILMVRPAPRCFQLFILRDPQLRFADPFWMTLACRVRFPER